MASFRLKLDPSAKQDLGLAKLVEISKQASLEQGIVGCHVLEAAPQIRAKMDQHRVTGVQDALVEYALLVEASHQRDLETFYQQVQLPGALTQNGWIVEQYALYQLIYELSQ